MTTTYVRLKNRRGNKADLPTPLAEGELGFALDTRELYIGGGDQDSKNRMVQVNNFLNAQNHTQSDINTRLVLFKLAGTDSYTANGSATSPTLTKVASKSITSSSDFVVTQYNLNNMPSIVSTTNYVQGNVGSTTFDFTFVTSAVPEANTVIVVSNWTTDEIVSEIANAVANISPAIETDQSSEDNQLYIDLTTGTGWIDVSDSGNTANVINAIANLDMIASADTNSNLNILGTIADLPYVSRSIEVDGNLLIDMDSPQQAVNLVTFLNKSQDSTESTVANNIKIYTQDSKPEIENNTYITYRGLLKTTIENKTSIDANANVSGFTNVVSFSSSDTNTVFLDYSLKFGSDSSIGTLKVISDGTSVSYVDDRTDITDTSEFTIQPVIDGSNLVIEYNNTNLSTTGTLYYTIKRWYTP